MVTASLHYVINYGDFDDQDGDDDTVSSDEEPVIGFWSSVVWLILMTAIIALLSEFVVGTIEVIKTFSRHSAVFKYPNKFKSDHVVLHSFFWD